MPLFIIWIGYYQRIGELLGVSILSLFLLINLASISPRLVFILAVKLCLFMLIQLHVGIFVATQCHLSALYRMPL